MSFDSAKLLLLGLVAAIVLPVVLAGASATKAQAPAERDCIPVAVVK